MNTNERIRLADRIVALGAVQCELKAEITKPEEQG